MFASNKIKKCTFNENQFCSCTEAVLCLCRMCFKFLHDGNRGSPLKFKHFDFLLSFKHKLSLTIGEQRFVLINKVIVESILYTNPSGFFVLLCRLEDFSL